MQEQESVQLYEFRMEFLDLVEKNIDNEQDGPTGEAHIDGNELIGEALDKAQTILETARIQSEKLKEEAYQRAMQEGYDAGYEKGYKKSYEDNAFKLRQEISQFEDEMVTFIEDMESKKDKVLETYIDDLKKIALAVAEKIIKTSLNSSEEIIKRMIISATDKLKKSEWAKIYITASDSSRMVKGDADLIRELVNLSNNIKIIVMDNEEEGNCIIELPEEIIDVSINTQLQNIKDILNNARL
jgi:flagellar assembly protein FliH